MVIPNFYVLRLDLRESNAIIYWTYLFHATIYYLLFIIYSLLFICLFIYLFFKHKYDSLERLRGAKMLAFAWKIVYRTEAL